MDGWMDDRKGTPAGRRHEYFYICYQGYLYLLHTYMHLYSANNLHARKLPELNLVTPPTLKLRQSKQQHLQSRNLQKKTQRKCENRLTKNQ